MSGASESSGMSGSVGQSAPGWGFASGRVADLIRTLCDEAVRRGVRIVASEKRGHIFFDQGHVVHAEFGEDVGLGAVVEMLQAGMVEFRPCARPWPSQPSLFFTADKLLAATRPGAALLTTGVRRKWDAVSAARGFSEPPPLPEIEEPVPPPGASPSSSAPAPSSAPASTRSPTTWAKATPAAGREQTPIDIDPPALTERVAPPGPAATLGVAASDLSRAVAAAVSRSTQSRSPESSTQPRPSARTERNWPELAATGANAGAAGALIPRVPVPSVSVPASKPPPSSRPATEAPSPTATAAVASRPPPSSRPATEAPSPTATAAVASRPPPSSRLSTEAPNSPATGALPSEAAGATLVEREPSAPPPRLRANAVVWVERSARRAPPSPLEVASSGTTSSRSFRHILPGTTPPPTSMVRVSGRGVILAARGDASEQLASAAAFIHNQAKLIAADLGRHGRTAVHLRGGGLSLLVLKSEVNDIAAALGPTGRLRSLLRKVGLG
jgi:hypothetical protein